MASRDARLSRFEDDFKRQQNEMANKIDTVLKAITNQIVGTLPSDTVKNPKLGAPSVSSTRSYPIIDPQYLSQPSTSINTIKAHLNDTITMPQQPKEPKLTLKDEFKDLHLNLPVLEVLIGDLGLFTLPCRLGDSEPFNTLADLGSCINIILLYLFKKLKIGLLEETDHIFGLVDGTKSYPVGIVKDVEVHIGKLKLLNDFYVLDMKKDPETPLLIGRGFLATANAVIDCRMAKIAVGEGIIRSVFGVKGVNLGEEEAPYWTTLGKRESYKPRPSMDGIGESKDLVQNKIDWNKPPKNEDRAWHVKIRIIDPDGEEFTKTLQSIPTTRRLSERENPKKIINLDHFYDTKAHLLEEKQIPIVEVLNRSFSEPRDGVKYHTRRHTSSSNGVTHLKTASARTDSNANLEDSFPDSVTTKRDAKEKDSDVMLIELIKDDEYPIKEELDENEDVVEEEEFEGDHFDKFPTRSELAYHKYLMSTLFPSMIDISLVIDPRMSPVVLRKPFVKLSNMTYDSSLGIVKLTNGVEAIAYKIAHKIDQYDSISNKEKENMKLVYHRNEEDKKKGVEYVMTLRLHLEEIHVIWAQFWKKPDKMENGRKGGLNINLQKVETASGLLVTPSRFASDNVRTLAKVSEHSRHKEILEDSR
ncbi:MAK10-like protein [Tanacetum coccineum]